MKRVIARLAAVGLFVCSGVVLTSPVADATAPSLLDTFRGCVQTERTGDVLLVFDESQSLGDTSRNGTDPQAKRVDAGKSLIDELQERGRAAKVELAVDIAGFAFQYDDGNDWVRLSDGTDRVKAEVEKYRERNTGYQTDYWAAINGARKSLLDRAKSGGSRCQLLVWFSDGELDLDLQGLGDTAESARKKLYAEGADLQTEAGHQDAERKAVQSLCREGGLADQLRRQKVATVGIGLTSADSPGGAQPAGDQFDVMKGIVEGTQVGGGPCGKYGKPKPGEFLLANASNLDFTFRTLLDGVKADQPVCAAADITSCKGFDLTLDGSLSQVDISAHSDVANLRLYLRAPGGKPSLLKAGRHSIQNRGSSYELRSAAATELSLQLRRDQTPPWDGVWSLIAQSPKAGADDTVQLAVDVRGNLAPVWLKPASMVSGSSTKLELGLTGGDGRAVAARNLAGTGELDVALTSASGQSIVSTSIDAKEADTTTVPVDLTGIAAGRATLTLSLGYTTAGVAGRPGTVLQPAVKSYDVTILPPPGGPLLTGDASVDFGSVTGPADTDAGVAFSGPGCVWFNGSQPQIPETVGEGVGEVRITSSAAAAGSCLRLAEGESKMLPLHLSTQNAGNGTLSGVLSVTVSPLDQPTRVSAVDVSYTADLNKPLNVGRFTAAFVIALLLGLGIPPLLLMITKYLTAKIPGRALLVERIPVRVVDGEVLRDGAPFALKDTDFRSMVPLGIKGTRRAEAAGLQLSTHTGWSPFGAGFVRVLSPGELALSSTVPAPEPRTGAARLPLALQGTWVLSRPSAGAPDEASVTLFVGTQQQGRQELVDSLRRRLPELMSVLSAPGADRSPGTSAEASSSFDDTAESGPTRSPFEDVWSSGPGRSQPGPAPSAGPTQSKDPFTFDDDRPST